MTRSLFHASLERPACTLHVRYRPAYSGRSVVFLHGAGMDGRMFDAQLRAIPAGVGVVCWDARGHGESELTGPFRYSDMLADLHAAVKASEARSVTLVGQSMGGNLAQSYVDAHPGAVERLVLIDCAPNHAPLTRVEKLALASAGTTLRAIPWRTTVRLSAEACGLRPETVAYATRCLERLGKQRFIEVMEFWRDALQPDAEYRLPVPTLALMGDHDRTGNIAQAMPRLAVGDPQVRLVTLRDAAHNSNMDQPEETNTHLIDFLGAEGE